MKKKHVKLITALAILFSFLSANNALAQFNPIYGPTAGGSGGNYFEEICDTGFSNGIRIRHGEHIDALGMRCENDNDSRPLYGGSGGTFTQYTCPNNYVMRGFNGRSGRLVDNLQPICVLKSNKSTTYTSTPVYGGTGGSFFSIWCGTGSAMVGIHGRSGRLLDQIGPICAQSPQ